MFGSIIDAVQPQITEEHNRFLLSPFTVEEVKNALFSMHPDKSLGPDDMNPAFYQKFWDVVGNDVAKFCLSAIADRKFPVGLNSTSIDLVPKIQNPEKLEDMRPIALCNVLYKIITKMLTNRLQ